MMLLPMMLAAAAGAPDQIYRGSITESPYVVNGPLNITRFVNGSASVQWFFDKDSHGSACIREGGLFAWNQSAGSVTLKASGQYYWFTGKRAGPSGFQGDMRSPSEVVGSWSVVLNGTPRQSCVPPAPPPTPVPAPTPPLPPAGVWPLPRSIECKAPGATLPVIASGMRISLAGLGASADVSIAAVKRYTPVLLSGHNVLKPASAGLLLASASPTVTNIEITVGSKLAPLSSATNYSYTLDYDSGSDTVSVSTASPFGVAYALETLSQLISGTQGARKLKCVSLSVRDSPQFEHRGQMIDTGRRFYPVPLVMSIIDGLAVSKMNVLHFHLSEQCFRVESAKFPQLASAPCLSGAHNNSAFYTQVQIAEIVAYARLRGVRVVPEFDMPGHSGGFCTALQSAGIRCCSSQIEDDPAGKSAAIINELLTEMAALFPDNVMHIGADETGTSAPCTAANTKSFEEKILKHVLALGKTPMGWQEVLLTTGAAASYPTTIVAQWYDPAGTTWWEIAKRGYRTVMNSDDQFYLNYPNTEARSLWFDLMAGNTCPDTACRKLLLGGETALWQDSYVGSCLFDSSQDANFSLSASRMIFPRAAVAAGTFWGGYRPIDDAYFGQMFAALQARLRARGIASCPAVAPTSNDCTALAVCREPPSSRWSTSCGTPLPGGSYC